MNQEEIAAECSRILQEALDASEYDICEAYQRACEKVAPDWKFEDCQMIDNVLWIAALPPVDFIEVEFTVKEHDAA